MTQIRGSRMDNQGLFSVYVLLISLSQISRSYFDMLQGGTTMAEGMVKY